MFPTGNLEDSIKSRRISQLERACSKDKKDYRDLLSDQQHMDNLVDNAFSFLDFDKLDYSSGNIMAAILEIKMTFCPLYR